MKIRKIFESDSKDILDEFTRCCEFIRDNHQIIRDEYYQLEDILLGLSEKYHLTIHNLSGRDDGFMVGIQLNTEGGQFGFGKWDTTKKSFVPELFKCLEKIYDRYPIMTFRIYLGGDNVITQQIQKSINSKRDEFYDLPNQIVKSSYFQTIMIHIDFETIIKNKFESLYK